MILIGYNKINIHTDIEAYMLYNFDNSVSFSIL